MKKLNNQPGIDPCLRITGATKDFGSVTAVDNLDLDIEQGEIFCLLGASGSGKTTLLRMIAGLETVNHGKIEIDGRDVTAVPPWSRPVSMMFQSYALFPHMNVGQNIAYGLKQDKWSEADVRARVSDLLNLVQLVGFDKREPHRLSGGQRQRVALARALARKPKVLLLDEPLSALDKKLREKTQQQLSMIQKETGTTFVMVTHDQDEAMSIATRIGVMDQGRLVHVDNPRGMYERPANRMLADLVGQVNLFEAKVQGKGKSRMIVSRDTGGILSPAGTNNLSEGQTVWIAVRPERIFLDAKSKDTARGAPNSAIGTLTGIRYLGATTHFVVTLASGTRIQASHSAHDAEQEAKLQVGDEVKVSFKKHSAILLEK